MSATGKILADLPNPFCCDDGTAVRSVADWNRRQAEMIICIVEIEYGGLPPVPAETRWEELHATTIGRFGGTRAITGRVIAGAARPFGFLMQMLAPVGSGRFPVVLTGDACWWDASDDVAAEVLRRGNILAQFNRVEIVPDVGRSDRVSGLYQTYPDATFGALAAWAWGYHRCVDALVGMDFVDSARIAIVGHSRGGKAALLAGATDDRIALTSANNSGTGGAGSYRIQGPQSETLADLMQAFPYWFGPSMKDFVGRETDMPFDQHLLKALVAPRALLTTEALGDLWANPYGTWQTHLAAREVYRFLGVEERIGFWFRDGHHDHNMSDWITFLDFMDLQFRRERTDRRFDRNPFPEAPPAFGWKAPAMTRSSHGDTSAGKFEERA
jgi:hypothetical protein